MNVNTLYPGNVGSQLSSEALCRSLKNALGINSPGGGAAGTREDAGSRNLREPCPNIVLPRSPAAMATFPVAMPPHPPNKARDPMAGYPCPSSITPPVPRCPPPQPLPSEGHTSVTVPSSTVDVGFAPLPERDPSISKQRALILTKNSNVDADLLDQALSDCYGRFVALLPEEVLRDHVRLCFYLRDAYWWYCDKWAVRHPNKLCPLKFGAFLTLVCDDCPLLRAFISDEEEKVLLENWSKYNQKIPLRGCMVMNKTCDKVLMVQSYNSNNWTFPRGKTDEEEADSACAAREVLEEVGLDVRELIHPEVFLEHVSNGRTLKLFFVPGVDENTKLGSNTEYEIGEIKWIRLSSLVEAHKRQMKQFRLFDVAQFVKGLWEFVRDFRRGDLREHFPGAYAAFCRVKESAEELPLLDGCGPGDPLPTSNGGHRSHLSKFQFNDQQKADRCYETFGETSGWSVDEMFRVNQEKFGRGGAVSSRAAASRFPPRRYIISQRAIAKQFYHRFFWFLSEMATVTTTIKTELCSFSDYRVYPGRGQKFVARDGKVYFFLTSKAASLHKQRVKPAKVKWTPSWRKANKKFQTVVSHRRRSKKAAKYQKAFLGLSLEELKAKRATAAKSDSKLNPKQAMLAEAKEKAKKLKGAAPKAAGAVPAKQVPIPKKITKTAMRK
ncbi:NUDIX family protein [Babesia ovata]|uniref:NUDIX family protein n=1 Tax=Babesia ovata TaxID=189622 RepID=A0A2H6K8H0_9APIC|nr:NUDIX family protein [Babesia ovata]GBE59297.1 NUDIX family protein [Babesia ovata]